VVVFDIVEKRIGAAGLQIGEGWPSKIAFILKLIVSG
jgi:hypothetical protein